MFLLQTACIYVTWGTDGLELGETGSCGNTTLLIQ